jgi:hypothetical protein
VTCTTSWTCSLATSATKAKRNGKEKLRCGIGRTFRIGQEARHETALLPHHLQPLPISNVRFVGDSRPLRRIGQITYAVAYLGAKYCHYSPSLTSIQIPLYLLCRIPFAHCIPYLLQQPILFSLTQSRVKIGAAYPVVGIIRVS